MPNDGLRWETSVPRSPEGDVGVARSQSRPDRSASARRWLRVDVSAQPRVRPRGWHPGPDGALQCQGEPPREGHADDVDDELQPAPTHLRPGAEGEPEGDVARSRDRRDGD